MRITINRLIASVIGLVLIGLDVWFGVLAFNSGTPADKLWLIINGTILCCAFCYAFFFLVVLFRVEHGHKEILIPNPFKRDYKEDEHYHEFLIWQREENSKRAQLEREVEEDMRKGNPLRPPKPPKPKQDRIG